MADATFAASGYSLVDYNRGSLSKAKTLSIGGRRRMRWALTPDGGTYPSGGIAISAARLGCPNNLESLRFLESDGATSDIFKWDKSAGKIKIFREAAGTIAEMVTTATPSFNELIVEVEGW